MKRFHINLSVRDLEKSIAFYNELFAAEPTRREDDYAKWMLDDPYINFALTPRGAQKGIDHIGLQASDEDELAAIRERLVRADSPILDEENANCCYANGKKAWISDPDGVAWETFHTRGDITNYGDGSGESPNHQGADRISDPGRPSGACC
jgi:lactoylglutathione lyase